MVSTLHRSVDPARVVEFAETASRLRAELARRIVGLEDVVEGLLIALLSGGHCLLVGVPGLAKTLLIQSMSELLALDFSRARQRCAPYDRGLEECGRLACVNGRESSLLGSRCSGFTRFRLPK